MAYRNTILSRKIESNVIFISRKRCKGTKER
jgi:hypothetical protein